MTLYWNDFKNAFISNRNVVYTIDQVREMKSLGFNIVCIYQGVKWKSTVMNVVHIWGLLNTCVKICGFVASHVNRKIIAER